MCACTHACIISVSFVHSTSDLGKISTPLWDFWQKRELLGTDYIFLLGAARPLAYDLGWTNTRSCLELWNWISDTKTDGQSKYYLCPCFQQHNGDSSANPEPEVSVPMSWHFSLGSNFSPWFLLYFNTDPKAFLPVLWATQHPFGKLHVQLKMEFHQISHYQN